MKFIIGRSSWCFHYYCCYACIIQLQYFTPTMMMMMFYYNPQLMVDSFSITCNQRISFKNRFCSCCRNTRDDYSTTTTSVQQLLPEEEQQPQHVIIVGGGIGGLAIAARIASDSASGVVQQQQPQQKTTISDMTTTTTRANTRITILEKNSFLGGRCGSYNVTIPSSTAKTTTATEQQQCEQPLLSFRHERGPSLLLLPQIYDELFHDVTNGTATSQDFNLFIQQCIPAYKIVFDDGDTINVGFPNQVVMETTASDIENRTSFEHDKSDNIQNLYIESRNTMNRFEVDGAKKWDEYMNLCCAYLECGLPNFIQEELNIASLPNFIQQGIIKNMGRNFPLLHHRNVLEQYFTSEKMMAVASFQDLYVGLQPFGNDDSNGKTNVYREGYDPTVAPAVFGLLSAIELHGKCLNNNCGVYAPIGGFHTVQQSIYNLLQSKYCPNVTILSNCTVVHVTNDGGVYYYLGNNHTASPTFMKGDLIVMNADLPYVEQSLLSQQQHHHGSRTQPTSTTRQPSNYAAYHEDTKTNQDTYDWSDKYRFSSGVIAFHWSINRTIYELNTHNVFLSVSNRTVAYQSWDHVRHHDTISTSSIFHDTNEPFNFYVHRASKTDPTAAPEGMDAILVLVPCPTIHRNVSYRSLPRNEAIERYKTEQFPEEFLDRVRTAVFHRLSVISTLSDIQDRILHESVDTPVSYADSYNVGAGTPFGLSHGLHQLSVFRPPSILNNLMSQQNGASPNIFYCGASTRPGNGVPLVLTGAKLVSKQVLEKLSEMQKNIQS